ncbi:MAG TPA: DUF2851 family protein [bacterium]|nr:DUF2851 family protein [bacterium]
MEDAAAQGLESELHRLWQSGILSGADLTTLDQRPIEILDCGRHNLDAGPDFLDALLRIGGELVRGDVEIHRTAAEWYLHHHDSDARYNRVVLHVAVATYSAVFSARRCDGSAAPTLLIDPALLASFLSHPPATADERRTCLLAALDPPLLLARLEAAAEERLRMHAARLMEMRRDDSWEQILYAGLLDALGYGKNQSPFRQLARRLPFDRLSGMIRELEDDEAIRCSEALLFGVAGLLPAGWHPHAYVRALQRYWRRAQRRADLEPMAAESWQFFRLRPANFPTRRIAACARLAARFRRGDLLSTLKGLVTASPDPVQALPALADLAVVEVGGFWADHYDFMMAAQSAHSRRRVRLIGRGRSREIAVNILLPALLACAQESEDGRLGAAVRTLFRLFPRTPENEITRRMRHQLFDPQDGRPGMLPGGAAWQQGMIQLDLMCCRRAACDGCRTPAGLQHPFC